ncbi:variant 2 [Lathyrus oleraceus]|uniref:Variant 2 n=1 Tax=Pisum sativum TaxID=3888 RepID=A0A9D5AQ99_PEA|nr:variant 2 [Pisum sativum]
MAYPFSSTFNIPLTRLPFFHRTTIPPSRIFCFSKNHNLLKDQPDETSATISVRLMKQLKSVVPILIASTIQLSFLFPLLDSVPYVSSPAAKAILYSPDTKVPRTGEVALRRAIPANSNMKAIQETLEDISYLLRIPQRKPYGTMDGNVKKVLKIAVDEKDSILASIPAELKEKASLVHATLIDGKALCLLL